MRVKTYFKAIALTTLLFSTKAQAQTEPQYLIFQLFTYGPNPQGLTQPFDSADVAFQIDSILSVVDGNRGDGVTKQLGFAVGPLSLDHTDTELRTTIRKSFQIAEAKNVAVCFHIDDAMFWINRQDLWSDTNNVEWSDWNRTIIPNRFVGWAPITLAPQMCYNSPTLLQEIQRITANVIGVEIKNGIDTLISHNKEQLFAGVIYGWETTLSDYRYVAPNDSNANSLGIPRVLMGYNALSNLGYSESPANIDSTLERVVHDWAAFGTMNLQQAGIDSNRIYTHFAFPTIPSSMLPWIFDTLSNHLGFQANIFGICQHALPKTAFNNHSRAGFSTYPVGFLESGVDGMLKQILDELPNHGNPHWASCEGTNSNSEISWGQYLSDMFNNGASLVNIFGWQDTPGSPYGIATHSPDAICAYKDFLIGSCTTNVESYDIDDYFEMYPNPATSTLNISFPENMKQQLQIFNSMGMLLKEISVTQQTQIDISDLPKGLYFVHLKNNSLAPTLNFIKQ
jgi:hypothetical protein